MRLIVPPVHLDVFHVVRLHVPVGVEEVLVDVPPAKEEGVVVLGHDAIDELRRLELRALRLRLGGRDD
eukprot:359858-Prymnesium_polylepis.1